jgi:hypothetical protein
VNETFCCCVSHEHVTTKVSPWSLQNALRPLHDGKTSNTHCSKILQETLLNSVSDELLSFMVGQSHDSFKLLSVKDVMLF